MSALTTWVVNADINWLMSGLVNVGNRIRVFRESLLLINKRNSKLYFISIVRLHIILNFYHLNNFLFLFIKKKIFYGANKIIKFHAYYRQILTAPYCLFYRDVSIILVYILKVITNQWVSSEFENFLLDRSTKAKICQKLRNTGIEYNLLLGFSNRIMHSFAT